MALFGPTMTCHAAGPQVAGHELRCQPGPNGGSVRPSSARGLGAPAADEDVDEAVATGEGAGLARRVARLQPLGALKG
jgi:tRNA-splicing ligase RtcB